MENDIAELQHKADYYRSILTEKQKRDIYLQSVENFLFFLEKFERRDIKIEIIQKLQAYFLELDAGNFLFTYTERRDILLSIIMPIGKHYEKRFSFKSHHGNVRLSIFMGINIDLVLLLVGWLKFFYYVPIMTLFFIAHWFYIKIFFGRHRRVY